MLKLRSEKKLKELPNKKRKLFRQKNQEQRNRQLLIEESSDAGSGFEIQRKTELSKRRRTGSLLTNEKKLLELKYMKAPAAYGKIKTNKKSQN